MSVELRWLIDLLSSSRAGGGSPKPTAFSRAAWPPKIVEAAERRHSRDAA